VIDVIGYAAHSPGAALEPFKFARRSPGPDDVQIEILYCGVCHTDLHFVRNGLGNTVYPIVPGHEIVGRVVAIGANVKKFALGDHVGVGCMVDSCRSCPSCRDGLEQYCIPGATFTYNSKEQGGGPNTLGGYSDQIVVDQNFVVKVPSTLELKAVAPLLCAGITMYSPLRHWKVGPGKKVGIIGLGGLGHIGVKLAKAMGARVVVLERSSKKADDAARLGADEVLVTTDPTAMAAHQGSFDVLLSTVPVSHDVNPYLHLLRVDGTLVMIGAMTALEPVVGGLLMMARRSLAGTGIGGIAETQEMLDFCAEHGIVCDVEMIGMTDIAKAFERLEKSDVRYRFVIDMKPLKLGARPPL
jgi:alcohol dehydrogenase (NADP+)